MIYISIAGIFVLEIHMKFSYLFCNLMYIYAGREALFKVLWGMVQTSDLLLPSDNLLHPLSKSPMIISDLRI
jgi:hypothetical protein